MYYIGIDVAKNFHVVSVIDENEVKVISKPFKFDNSNDGFSKLLTTLDSISLEKKEFLIGLEATGIYGENLLEYLVTPEKAIKALYLGV